MKGILAVSTRREVGKMVLSDFMRRASVLSSFSLSLFCVIQVFYVRNACLHGQGDVAYLIRRTCQGKCVVLKRLDRDKMSFNQTGKKCRVKKEEGRTTIATTTTKRKPYGTPKKTVAGLKETQKQLCPVMITAEPNSPSAKRRLTGDRKQNQRFSRFSALLV